MSPGLKRVVVVALALGVAWYALRDRSAEAPLAASSGAQSGPVLLTPAPADSAPKPGADRSVFSQSASGTQMRVQGRVERLLADDNAGSRHQRFIIRVDAAITLLIAHNIDLAPRLEGLAAGDAVEVYGEYEWNDRGGLLHWTHRDPGGKHLAGYIEWRGRRYQ